MDNIDYCEKLQQGFFSKHSELIPFVGENYAKNKILIIGESHYIGQELQKKDGSSDFDDSSDFFNLDYFIDEWWSNNPTRLDDKYGDSYNTKKVINNFTEGDRKKGYLIFTNLTKAYSNYLGKPISHIDINNSKVFQDFAFMNFFQMPSVFKGMKYWDSLKKCEKFGNVTAIETWNNCVKISSQVVSEVIAVLKPNIVIFCSKSAFSAFSKSIYYEEYKGIIRNVPHPSCRWWKEKSKNNNNKTGEELFIDILNNALEQK